VLVLTKTTALGGAERLVMNTLPYLDRESFSYRFAALDDEGPLASACADGGYPFAALPHRRAADPRSAWALRRVLVRDRVDLVHAHLPVPGALARIAARGLPTRVVYTEHTTQDVYRPASRWLNSASYGWQDAVIAVSAQVRASAEAHIGPAARGRIAVIPNGVDFAQIERDAALRPGALPARRPGALAVLVPANLTPVKGHDVLLESLSLLRGRGGAPFDVWLAGQGASRAALEARARRTGLDGRVHFLGKRGDIFALMRAADIIALPSRREGHPLALLEALALGRPAVASAVGGIPEIIDSERTGLLVAPGDPRALAGALERLGTDANLRARLGRDATRDAHRRFDIRRTVAAVEELYHRTGADEEVSAR
jgi:glycosyltransferase involved in cell wall biosynthesis